MSTRDARPHFHERNCSRLPIKVSHMRYKDGRRHHCFCSRMYVGPCSQDRVNLGVKQSEMNFHAEPKIPPVGAEKGTQISGKNFYDSYILEGLLNTDIKTYDSSAYNVDGKTDDTDPLSDIKNILLKTNEKLDIILNALVDKKERLVNNLARDSVSKSKKSQVKLRSKMECSSNSALPLMRESETLFDTLSRLSLWPRCVSSTCLSKLQPNQFFISPYFPPYYVKPISHYNYFKILGPKYSASDMSNNLWSPFMFTATNLTVNKVQRCGITERSGQALDTENRNRFDEENSNGVEYYEDRSYNFPPGIEEEGDTGSDADAVDVNKKIS